MQSRSVDQIIAEINKNPAKPPVSQIIVDTPELSGASQDDVNRILNAAYARNSHLNKNGRNNQGDAAIHAAIRKTYPRALEWVLKQQNVKMSLLSTDEKASPDKRETPLVMLVQHFNPKRHPESTSVVDDKKAMDVKQAQQTQQTPDQINQAKCLELFLQRIPNLSFWNKIAAENHNKAVSKACEHGCAYYADYYLNVLHKGVPAKKLAELIDYEEELERATIKGYFDVIDLFLTRFSDLSIGTKWLHIHTAAKHGHLEVLKRLLQYYLWIAKDKSLMSPEKLSGSNTSALSYALLFYYENKNELNKTKQMISAIKKSGAKWQESDFKEIIDRDDADSLRLLVDEGVDLAKWTIERKNKNENVREDLINYATFLNKKNVVKYLVSIGHLASFWRDIPSGQYPGALKRAAGKCPIDIVKLLLHESGNRIFNSSITIFDELIEQANKREDNSKVSIVRYMTALKAFRDNDVATLGRMISEMQADVPQDYTDLQKLLEKIMQERKQEADAKNARDQKEQADALKAQADILRAIEKAKQFKTSLEEKANEGYPQSSNNVVNGIQPSSPDTNAARVIVDNKSIAAEIKTPNLNLAPAAQPISAVLLSAGQSNPSESMSFEIVPPAAPGGPGLKSAASVTTASSLVQAVTPALAVPVVTPAPAVPAVTPAQGVPKPVQAVIPVPAVPVPVQAVTPVPAVPVPVQAVTPVPAVPVPVQAVTPAPGVPVSVQAVIPVQAAEPVQAVIPASAVSVPAPAQAAVIPVPAPVQAVTPVPGVPVSVQAVTPAPGVPVSVQAVIPVQAVPEPVQAVIPASAVAVSVLAPAQAAVIPVPAPVQAVTPVPAVPVPMQDPTPAPVFLPEYKTQQAAMRTAVQVQQQEGSVDSDSIASFGSSVQIEIAEGGVNPPLLSHSFPSNLCRATPTLFQPASTAANPARQEFAKDILAVAMLLVQVDHMEMSEATRNQLKLQYYSMISRLADKGALKSSDEVVRSLGPR